MSKKRRRKREGEEVSFCLGRRLRESIEREKRLEILSSLSLSSSLYLEEPFAAPASQLY